MERIVSVTPLAVERDGRTFTQAASMSRLGYESIVVEGQASLLHRESLPFGLRTVSHPSASGGRGGGRFTEKALEFLQPSPSERWVVNFLWHHGPQGARAIPRASLYYMASAWPFPAVYLRSRRYGAPFIYDAQDFYPALPPSDPLAARFLVAMERACIARAAAAVTTSAGLADLIQAQFGRRPLVIRNCHDARLDRPCETDLRTLLRLPDDGFLVVALGNAKPGAAIREAIESMAQLPSRVHLAFVGAGHEPYSAEIRERGLGDRIHLVNPVPPDQVVPFIRTADAAVITYFPLTVNYQHILPARFFLSAAAGLPLLFPGVLPELAAIANKYELGLEIDPQRPESLAGSLTALLENPELCQRYRTNAHRASQQLSWESEENRLLEIVEDALGRAYP